MPGKGKGGYYYLASDDNGRYVVNINMKVHFLKYFNDE